MTLNICLLQTELSWEDPAANREYFDSLLQDLAPADLVVLPEMFSTGFSMACDRLAETMDGATVNWMRLQAARLDCALCGSLIIQANGQFYNRFIWMSANGEVQWYDKRHLFRMSAEHQHYSAGTQRLIVSLQGFRICPQICYDLRFPVWSRNQNDYDLLLYVANWPAARRLHWRSLLRARAIENQSYVIGLNRVGVDGLGAAYSGDSLVIDFNGVDLADLQAATTVQRVSLDRAALLAYRQSFPAWHDADAYLLN
jgi:omega-amidase